MRARGPARTAALLASLLAASACMEVVYDITTDERLVTVPATNRLESSVETGRIDLPTKIGTDKTIDSVTLDLSTTNFNAENPVTVTISAASSLAPNAFRPIATIEVGADTGRDVRVVQTDPDDALVLAVQSDFVNIRFDAVSPAPGIGEIEFRFTIRLLAHKRTPGTGAGTLLFY